MRGDRSCSPRSVATTRKHMTHRLEHRAGTSCRRQQTAPAQPSYSPRRGVTGIVGVSRTSAGIFKPTGP